MQDSPFNKSLKTSRSPPPSRGHSSTRPHTPPRPMDDGGTSDVVSTAEIQSWMTSIDQCLNEVCSISAEGKLNSDQKLRISNLCRKVGHGTSQLAVQYQALKQKAVLMNANLHALQDKEDISKCLQDLHQSIAESPKIISQAKPSYADLVKKSTNNFVKPSPLNSN